jgi:hypothetical protein
MVIGRDISPKPDLSDNFGYILNAFYTIYMVDGTPEYKALVDKALASLASPKYKDYRWTQGDSYDSTADGIEGAITLSSFIKTKGIETWLDRQIKTLWLLEDMKQTATPHPYAYGYLYGNGIRSATMYLLMKTRGVRLEPWNENMSMGSEERDGTLYVYMKTNRPWQGNVAFDTARHSNVWNFPENYPRINMFPEWFVVDVKKVYDIRDDKGALMGSYSGAELAQGIPFFVDAELKISVKER